MISNGDDKLCKICSAVNLFPSFISLYNYYNFQLVIHLFTFTLALLSLKHIFTYHLILVLLLLLLLLLPFSHSVMSNSLCPNGPKHTRFPCPSLFPRACPNSCPLSRDVIQLSHPLLAPSPPSFSLSQHQDLFQWVGCSYQVSKILELQLQYQFF